MKIMEKYNDTSCEPMEIDLSSHSVSKMDISYVEHTFEKSQVVDENEKDIKKVICVNNLVIAQKHNIMRRTKQRKLWILIGAVALFLAVLIYHIKNFQCKEHLNTRQLKDTLLTKLYGQASAVKTLMRALEFDTSSKIIILYGGTGVGKTYAASLILENMLNYSNTYHYTMPGFLQKSSDFMFGLLFCKSSLIVIDGLIRSDIMDIKNNIYDLVKKSEELSKKITIILLFNCNFMTEKLFQKCNDIDFVRELNQSLANVKSIKYFVKFESLNDIHLRLCIENEFSNKKLSEAEFIKIQKNFNVHLDGCKGVYQKMKYLNII